MEGGRRGYFSPEACHPRRIVSAQIRRRADSDWSDGVWNWLATGQGGWSESRRASSVQGAGDRKGDVVVQGLGSNSNMGDGVIRGPGLGWNNRFLQDDLV